MSWEFRGSGTILVNDELVVMAASIFQAQIQIVCSVIGELITRSVPDPWNSQIYILPSCLGQSTDETPNEWSRGD
jgi:hypothetical protein